MDLWRNERYKGVLLALVFASSTSIGLFILRVLTTGSYRYGFMVWNLILAWVPLFFAILLIKIFRENRWLSWQGIIFSFLWLGFLPNSFYIVTDFIHLRFTGEISLLYDAVMLTSFAANGLILGFASLAIVHLQLLKHYKAKFVHLGIASVLLACSFAIYLGRYLRWNTWDVLVNPAGLLYDVTDRLINPGAYPSTFTTTTTFFILLGSLYLVAYHLALIVDSTGPTPRKSKKSKV